MAELTKDEKMRKWKWLLTEFFWHLRVKIKKTFGIEPTIQEMMHVMDIGDFVKYRENRLEYKLSGPLMLSEIIYYNEKRLYTEEKHNTNREGR